MKDNLFPKLKKVTELKNHEYIIPENIVNGNEITNLLTFQKFKEFFTNIKEIEFKFWSIH